MRKLILISLATVMSAPAYAQNADLQNSIQSMTNQIVGDALAQAGVHGKKADRPHNSDALNFTNTEIKNQDYSGRNLSGSSLMNAEFTNVHFDDVDFSGSQFTNVEFYNCTFTNVNFAGVEIMNGIFDHADVRGADFSGAVLTNTEFTNGSMMYGVDLSRADVTNVSYEDADFNTPLRVTSHSIIEKLTIAPTDTRYHKTPNIDLAIQFEFDSDKLKGDAWDQLKDLADALKSEALAGSKFSIEGHTDAKGSDDYNMDLSYRRASTVRKVLIESFGLKDDRLSIKGYGEDRPVADNETDYGRAMNRRVTIAKM